MRNSCQLVVWVFWMTESGAYPFFFQSVHSCRAEMASGESSLVSLAPEPQNHGRNWKLPSSVLIAEKVMPFLPAALTLARAAVREAQSLTEVGSTPAADEHLLVVVEGEGVGADRHAVGLAVDLAGGQQVGQDVGRVGA